MYGRVMTITTLVATIGFDEKFAIRSIVKHISEIERFIAVTSVPLDSRVSKALGLVEQFLNTYISDAEKKIEVHKVEIDVKNPYDAISVLRREIFEKFSGPYIVNLSGGMRALVVEVLAALVISGVRGIIEIELENFLGTIEIDPKLFYIGKLSENKAKIIKEIAKRKKVTYKDIARELGLPRATVFRELKLLRILGLIKVEKEERNSFYYLTDLGKAYQ